MLCEVGLGQAQPRARLVGAMSLLGIALGSAQGPFRHLLWGFADNNGAKKPPWPSQTVRPP